jgi:hypothetical protein
VEGEFMADEVQNKSQAMPKIFISYKTREHYKHVGLIRKTLDDTGFPTWLDKENGVSEWRTWGLDHFLIDGLRRADVLIFLVSLQQYELTRWQKFKEFFDPIGLEMSTDLAQNLFPALLEFNIRWYQFAYGINIQKGNNESLQEWEHRLAGNFGVPVLPVKIVDGDQTPAINEDDICLLHDQSLEEDFRSKIIPQLISRSKEKHGLEIKAKSRRAIRVMKLFGVFILIFILIAAAIEKVKDAILWLPRKIWQFIRWMVGHISKWLAALAVKRK